MRINPLIVLFSLAAAPCAAQGIVVPVACTGECPARPRLPQILALDTVKAWANLEHGTAITYVDHDFRNTTEWTVDAALFFPLPEGAVVTRVSVEDAAKAAHDNSRLLQYNEWSRPAESQWILQGLIREARNSRLGEYEGQVLVHVAVRDIPPGGVRSVQIAYTQPLRAEDGGAIAYLYPLSTGAAASPIGELRLGMTIKTDAGFADVGSPTHAVDLELGMESGPCHPRARCGSRGYPSERVRVVRLDARADDRRRDFRLVYTPHGGPPRPDLIRIPWRDGSDADIDPGDVRPSPR
jgi:hypothetical protein